MKRLLYAAALVAVMGLIGCGSKVDDKETSTVNNTVTQEKTTEEVVDISGINPYAVKEIQSVLDEINANVSADDKETSDNVIKQAVSLRALAAGNSLVEEQVERVVKYWKQNNNVSDFNKKLALVYAEYEKLGTSSAEAELSKIGLSMQGHEYCGNGKLDVVKWINKYMK